MKKIITFQAYYEFESEAPRRIPTESSLEAEIVDTVLLEGETYYLTMYRRGKTAYIVSPKDVLTIQII